MSIGMLEIPMRYSTHDCKCHCNCHNTCFKFFWGKDADRPQQTATIKLCPTERLKLSIWICVQVWPCCCSTMLAIMISRARYPGRKRGAAKEKRKGWVLWCFLPATAELHQGCSTATDVKGPCGPLLASSWKSLAAQKRTALCSWERAVTETKCCVDPTRRLCLILLRH